MTTKIQKQLDRIGKEHKATIRESKPEDWKPWATSSTIARVKQPDFIFELSANNKVYILSRRSVTSSNVVGVCEAPSQELLGMIEEWSKK